MYLIAFKQLFFILLCGQMLKFARSSEFVPLMLWSNAKWVGFAYNVFSSFIVYVKYQIIVYEVHDLVGFFCNALLTVFGASALTCHCSMLAFHAIYQKQYSAFVHETLFPRFVNLEHKTHTCTKTFISKPNGLLSQKLCHCTTQGHTLSDILMRAAHWMAWILARDQLIWLFWGRYRYISHSWTDSRYFQNF